MKYTTTTLAAIALTASLNAGILTSEPSYLNAQAQSNFNFEPILTVGDLVPMAGAQAGEEYAMCGIPDAMGIYRDRVSGERVLFLAHEMRSSANSQPFPGQPRLKGAFVSRFVMDSDASINEGGIAHANVITPDGTFNNPVEGDANAFTRFCSGAFAGRREGLDRPFFFTNEESGRGNYDGDVLGSQSVAVVDGNLHTLPALGRLARETTVVQPRRDRNTVVISTEDAGYPSYVYMYVGTKSRSGSDPVAKNGLSDGSVFVLASKGAQADPSLQNNCGTFTDEGAANALDVEWVEIPNAASLSASNLEAAADAAGGFAFNRMEDAEFDPAKPTRTLYLGATGGSRSNTLGRLYEVSLDPVNPTADGQMSIVYNADTRVAPGGTFTGSVGRQLAANGGSDTSGTYAGGDINNGVDYPVSVDNIAVSKDFIVICEDRNSPAEAVFAQYSRNGGVWSLDRNNGLQAKYEADFNFAYVNNRDGLDLPAGRWEASGVITSDHVFGPGTFVINVQAHGGDRTNVPDGEGGFLTADEANDRFVEDGQLLIMRPTATR